MLIAQDPFAMGYLSVQLAYDFLQGYIAKVPDNFTTWFHVVTPENLNGPETQRWIYKKEPPQ
jgi:ABC-type sugar transport system substrate-binding protein